MRTNALTLLAAAAGVVGVVGLALATHNEPSSARTLLSSLVTAYPECNGTSVGIPGTPPPGWTGCTAAQSDPACGFDPSVTDSGGSFTVNISGGTIHLTASAEAIDPMCNNETLSLVVSVRVTTDDCTTPPCTIVEGITQDFPTGLTCTVEGGDCRISGTIPAGIFTAGAMTGFQFEGCSLKHNGMHAIDCGLLYK